MIFVYFKDGRCVAFDADVWNFNDVSNNNVYLMKNKKVIAHLNWSEVLYTSDERMVLHD